MWQYLQGEEDAKVAHIKLAQTHAEGGCVSMGTEGTGVLQGSHADAKRHKYPDTICSGCGDTCDGGCLQGMNRYQLVLDGRGRLETSGRYKLCSHHAGTLGATFGMHIFRP